MHKKYHLSEQAIVVIAWLFFSVMTAWVTAHHVPWRDEAYAWLIARELPWKNIYGEAGANGAPSLWYYILAFPAKLGLPYGSMQAIHWLFASMAAGLFLAKAPFHWSLRTAFTFTQYIAYEHSVLSRPYVLTLLFIWAACAWQRKKQEQPVAYGIIIALLANSSFFGLVAALYFAVDFYVKEERHWRSIPPRQKAAGVLMLAGLVISAIDFIPIKDTQPYYQQNFYFNRPMKFLEMIYAAYIPPAFWKIVPAAAVEAGQWLTPVLSLGLFILVVHFIEKRMAYGVMAFFALSWLVIAYIAVFKYEWPSPRHYSFCAVYLVMCLWLAMDGNSSSPPADRCRLLPKTLTLLLGLSWGVGAVTTIYSVEMEQILPYSASQAMAKFMVEKGIDKKFLTSDRPELAVAFLPYMPAASLWDPRKEKFVRYSYSRSNDRLYMAVEEVLKRVKEHGFMTNGDVYLLTFDPITNAKELHLTKIYDSYGWNEGASLYKLTVVP